MIKKYKFLFLLLFALFVFLPKDTFALDFTTNGYGCDYFKDGSSFCGNLKLYTNGSVNQKVLGLPYTTNAKTWKYYVNNLSYSVIDQYNQSFCSGEDGGTWDTWVWFTQPVADGFNVSVNVSNVGQLNCSQSTISNGYGKVLNCVVPKSFSSNTISWTFQVTNGNVADYAWPYNLEFGIGNYTYNTETCVADNTDLIINNDNMNTDKIIQSNEQIKKEQEQTNKELGKLNDNLTDNDISDSQSEASGFFDDFESDDFGLSDIITMPLTFIQGLSSSTCYSLNLPLPFVDTNVSLPCMTSIYQRYFGSFLTLYQTITTGIIAYWCCINIFRMVQGFKNPDSDEIEVMEL